MASFCSPIEALFEKTYKKVNHKIFSVLFLYEVGNALAVLHASAKLVKGYRIDVDDGETHAFCLDLELPKGTGMGPSALELALMSFAGCYVTIFIMTANKMRIFVEDVETKMEAIKSEEEGTITHVKCDIMIKTSAPEDRIKRAHEVTVDTCPVGILFEKAGVKTNYNLRIEKK
jgi:uncharacterized OsmC-like protein